jgi:hypothetical protein
VFSGNIANFGKPQEYKVAQVFLKKLLGLLAARYTSTKFKFMAHRGNEWVNMSRKLPIR